VEGDPFFKKPQEGYIGRGGGIYSVKEILFGKEKRRGKNAGLYDSSPG